MYSSCTTLSKKQVLNAYILLQPAIVNRVLMMVELENKSQAKNYLSAVESKILNLISPKLE